MVYYEIEKEYYLVIFPTDNPIEIYQCDDDGELKPTNVNFEFSFRIPKTFLTDAFCYEFTEKDIQKLVQDLNDGKIHIIDTINGFDFRLSIPQQYCHLTINNE